MNLSKIFLGFCIYTLQSAANGFKDLGSILAMLSEVSAIVYNLASIRRNKLSIDECFWLNVDSLISNTDLSSDGAVELMVIRYSRW
jgi:hypothetical protein